jgi:hypothetical protein
MFQIASRSASLGKSTKSNSSNLPFLGISGGSWGLGGTGGSPRPSARKLLQWRRNMKAVLLLVTLLAAMPLPGAPLENLPRLTVGTGIGSEVFSNVTVTSVNCHTHLL